MKRTKRNINNVLKRLKNRSVEKFYNQWSENGMEISFRKCLQSSFIGENMMMMMLKKNNLKKKMKVKTNLQMITIIKKSRNDFVLRCHSIIFSDKIGKFYY